MFFHCRIGALRRALALGVMLAAAVAVQAEPEPLSLQADGRRIVVEICADNIIHILSGPPAAPANTLVNSVTQRCELAPAAANVDAQGLHVRTHSLRVDVDAASGRVRFARIDGGVILEETANRHEPSAGVRRTFRLAPDESLYGLGQRQDGSLDLRGAPVRLQQANTNIAIPFLVSTAGYGLLWNNASLTDFNPADEEVSLNAEGEGEFVADEAGDYGLLLAGDGRERLHLTANGQTVFDIRNMWTPPSAGGVVHLAAGAVCRAKAEAGRGARLWLRRPTPTMAFQSEAGGWADYYLVYAPTPSEAVAGYRRLTGAAPLLPRWAYGFWQCRERYSSQQQILDAAAEFRRRRIPVDVLVQDWQYWGKYGWNAMRFDEAFYPEPSQMIARLRDMRLHLAVSVWSKFGAETEAGRAFRDARLTLRAAARAGEPGESQEPESWMDAFDPGAQKLFWSTIRDGLGRLGVDAWWLDADEPEGDPLKDDQTFLGAGREVRNAYPLYVTSSVYEGQRAADPGKRVTILSRSAYAGQQRNGSISWSGDIAGDWDSLRRQIPAGLSFSASGMPYWTTDIGGFFRPKDQYSSEEYRELLVRWFEFGAFSPIFRIHGYQSETEMWKYGASTEKILRRYDELRYRLLPYIYSAAWAVTSRGRSMMQALPLAYPDDASLRRTGDEFLFGDSLLVAPVTEKGARRRMVRLPSGDDWVDFWTGERRRGGGLIAVDAPLDRLPMFARVGSILPMGPLAQSAGEAPRELELRIYAGRDADFELYADGGDGYAYEKGLRSVVRLHWDDQRGRLSIGRREGSYPGMAKRLPLRIVRVRRNAGVGDAPSRRASAVVVYEGRALHVDLPRN